MKLISIFVSRLQHQVKKHNLVVASYDVVRNDIDFFRWVLLKLKISLCFGGSCTFLWPGFLFFYFCRNIKFNYCILDEGHVIKNGKTKLSKAIKQLAANFRLILSGTPIQVRACLCLLICEIQFLFFCICLWVRTWILFLSFHRTTSWSSGRSLTSSCRASLEQSVSLLLVTANQSWPAVMPKVPQGNRKQVCWLLLCNF